jgi:hypothetical protein
MTIAWRVTSSDLEYLALCDSSLLLSFTDGRHLEVTDDRQSQTFEPWSEAAPTRRSKGGLSISPHDFGAPSRDEVKSLCNTSEGFWCADPHTRNPIRAPGSRSCGRCIDHRTQPRGRGSPGEIAQCDFRFPDIEVPVGLGQGRAMGSRAAL